MSFLRKAKKENTDMKKKVREGFESGKKIETNFVVKANYALLTSYAPARSF